MGWPMWQPIRREKQLVGSQALHARFRRRAGGSSCPCRRSLPAAWAADCRAALVAERQGNRLYRRLIATRERRAGMCGYPGSGRRSAQSDAAAASTPAWIEWNDNRSLYVSELSGSDSRLVRLLLQSDPAGLNLSVNAESTIFRIPANIGDGAWSSAFPPPPTTHSSLFKPALLRRAGDLHRQNCCPSNEPIRRLRPFGQLSHFNDGVEPAWGKSISLNWKSDQFSSAGLADAAQRLRSAKKYR